MKTLYVNINSQDVISNDDVEVLNHDLKSDLYFAIGDKLVEGTGQSVNKIDLITEFNEEQHSADYSLILAQCEQLKRTLFNGFSHSTYEIVLPDSYGTWLKYHSNDSYRIIHMKYSDKPIVVTLDLDDVYEDCIEFLRRKIIRYLRKDDLYKQIDKFVFGDKCVAETAKIIQSINSEYPHISFVPLEDFEEELDGKGPMRGGDPPMGGEDFDDEIQYMFVTRNGDPYRESYEVYDSTGRKLEDIDYILPVGSRGCHSFIIGLNTKDKMLYFVSNKQILSLCDWSDGELDCEKYNGLLHKYRGRYYYGGVLVSKRLIIDDGCKSFIIRDKYDYETHYKIENGICSQTTEDELKKITNSLYYIDDTFDEYPKCMSSLTGTEFTIPGFKVIIYLGNTKGKDVFWAIKKFQAGQVRFKESYIVDSEGEVIRVYDYNIAYPLCGKYIFDVNDTGFIVSISDLDGNQVMLMKPHLCGHNYNILDVREIEPDVFYIPIDYACSKNDSLYWLVKENVLCNSYDNNYYYVNDDSGYLQYKVFKRGNNELVGYGDKFVELDGIYYCQNFEDKGYSYMTFFDNKGVEIYRLNKDCYFRESVVRWGDNSFCVGENRIVIDFEGRYYKILDYSANEIARIDPVQLVERYRNGKLFYYDGVKLGFFDDEGNNHILHFDKGYIKSVYVISDNRLLVKTESDAESFYLLNFDGDVLLEGINSESAKFDHRFIAYYKESANYTTCYVVDLDGNDLFKTETSPCNVSVIDGGILNW